jgi:hypothetical protein
MEFGAKFVLSPTYLEKIGTLNSTDTVNVPEKLRGQKNL